MPGRFNDRAEAGRALAEKLTEYAGRNDVIVLALPRGGVPVAYEVAEALGVPLDVLVVRKLGSPGHPELAMGAIASGGARVLNEDVIKQAHVSEEQLEAETARQRTELERREREYRGEKPFPGLEGKTIIIVDDGLATGATMHAAVRALQQFDPQEIIVAVPVAPPHAGRRMVSDADRFVAVAEPAPFYAVGQWYVNFDQTSDEEVRELLEKHSRGVLE